MSKMRVFLSHTQTDLDFARQLKEGLVAAGADAWLDDDDLTGPLPETIKREITRRPVFVLITSDTALLSNSVGDEINLAYSRHGVAPDRIELAVLASDTDLSLMDAWVSGFLRIEAIRGTAYPAAQAIQETVVELQRRVMRYYPDHVATAVRARYNELGGAKNPSLGSLLLVDRDAAKPDTSPQRTEGYHFWYSGGEGSAAIYWSKRGGAQAVWGDIRKVYEGRGSRHGFPLTGEVQAMTSPQGTNGVYQRFEGEQNYPEDVTGPVRYGATIYWCPAYKARTTRGNIGEYYERLGATNSPLGFPMDYGREAIKSPQGTTGWYQVFEGGTVHWSQPTGSKMTSGPIHRFYLSQHGSREWLGFPVSEAIECAASPFGTTGVCQRFEGPWVYPNDVIELVAGARCGTTVYFSERYDVQPVGRGIGVTYERMHGTGGPLGFPMSDEERVPGSAPNSADRVQRFEGGAIYYRYDRQRRHLIVPVLNAVYEKYAASGGPAGDYGFPLSPSEPAPSAAPGERIQRFEGGIITVQNSPEG